MHNGFVAATAEHKSLLKCHSFEGFTLNPSKKKLLLNVLRKFFFHVMRNVTAHPLCTAAIYFLSGKFTTQRT